MTLAEWMKRAGVTDAWVAEKVKRERSLITRIRNGIGRPSLEVAVAIEGLTEGEVKPADLLAAPAESEAAA